MGRWATLAAIVSLGIFLAGCTTTGQLASLETLNGKTLNQIVAQYGQPEDSFTFSMSDILKMKDAPVTQKVRGMYVGKKTKDLEIKSCDWTFGSTCVTMYFHQNNNEWTFLHADQGESSVVQ